MDFLNTVSSREWWLQLGATELARAPAQQRPLQPGDEVFGDQGDGAHDHHCRPDAVGVERVLRVTNQVPQPALRPDELADDRTDECEAEADVQARQNPGERGRENNVTGHLPP